MSMKTAGDLGNLEESLRPSLGRMLFTGCVHDSTRVRRRAADDYGSIHPLHHRFSGDRRTFMVSDGVQSGPQRKTQSHRFAGASGNQRCEHETTQSNGHCFSRAFSPATTGRQCSSSKVQFRKPVPSCLDHNFAYISEGEPQSITNTRFELRRFRKQGLSKCECAAPTQPSNQPDADSQVLSGLGRDWNVRKIRMKGWI